MRGPTVNRPAPTAHEDIYYRELAGCPPMSVEEERRHARRLAELRAELGAPPHDPEGPLANLVAEHRALQQRFVRANLRLVVKIAAQYHGGGPSRGQGLIGLADLIQEGNLGLMTAIERFDPGREVRFCTYAAWWIRHRVSRACHDHGRPVRIPSHIAQTASKLRRARRALESERRGVDLDAIARRAGVSTTRAKSALNATRSGLSLETPLAGDGARTLRDTLVDDQLGVDERMASRQHASRVRGALAKLRPIEADILRHRFAFEGDGPVTLRELGQRHALSRERVRQVQNAALRRLKDELSADGVTTA
ncbi:MAG: sigma-70 family RNA polymerase sigma factor [Myxococcota bacterium]